MLRKQEYLIVTGAWRENIKLGIAIYPEIIIFYFSLIDDS